MIVIYYGASINKIINEHPDAIDFYKIFNTDNNSFIEDIFINFIKVLKKHQSTATYSFIYSGLAIPDRIKEELTGLWYDFILVETCKSDIDSMNKEEVESYYSYVNSEDGDDSFYKTKAWIDIRSFVLNRDDYVCQRCGQYGTVVHHLIPYKIESRYKLDPRNLVCLCSKCHNSFHRRDNGGVMGLTAEGIKFGNKKLKRTGIDFVLM